MTTPIAHIDPDVSIDKEPAVPGFPAITHVAVTVNDLERSTRWYSALFDSAPVLDEDEETGGFHHTVFALGRGQLFGLHTHGHGTGGRFDERRVGLDHVAFACRNRDELQTWAARLHKLDVADCVRAPSGRRRRRAILMPWPTTRSSRTACVSSCDTRTA